MKYYFLLWVATIFGQLFVAAFSIWYFQRNVPISYWKAVKVYFSKELATYVMILTATILVTFMLSDWMDLNLTQADLKSKVKLENFEKYQRRFRTYATLWGIFAPLLCYVFYKGGQRATESFGKSKGVDIELMPKP